MEGRRPVLVLTRKANQSIMIGDEVEVSVLAVMGEKVRIGIEAPRAVPVFRKEVWIDMQRRPTATRGEREEVGEALRSASKGTCRVSAQAAQPRAC